MKAYRGRRVIAPLILNLGATGEWVNITPGTLYSQERGPIPNEQEDELGRALNLN